MKKSFSVFFPCMSVIEVNNIAREDGTLSDKSVYSGTVLIGLNRVDEFCAC